MDHDDTQRSLVVRLVTRLAPILLVVAFVTAFAVASRMAGVAAEFRFRSAGDLGGWLVQGHVRGHAVEHERLLVDPAGPDPRLVLPATLDSSQVDWIELRVRFVNPDYQGVWAARGIHEAIYHEMSLYWLSADRPTPSEDAMVLAETRMDGTSHTVRFPVGAHSEWRGEVSHLIVDLLDMRAPPSRIEIEHIRLLRQRLSPLGSWPVLALLCGGWVGAARLARAATRPDARPRRRLARACLALLAPLSVLFVAEASLNLAGFSEPFSNDLVQIVFNEVESPGMSRLFRYDPDCLFALRPGAAYRDGERINRIGLRGPVRPSSKPPGLLRVATFGDSSTFGYGLDLEDTYAARLEARLAEATAAPVEVINAGVIAYTIVQGYELFATRLVDYEPDVITLAFGVFNEHYPIPLSDLERLQVTRRIPRLVYELRKTLLTHSKTAQLTSRLLRQGRSPGGTDWEAVGQRRRVSPDEFSRTLDRFLELCRRHDVELMLISFPRRRIIEERYPVLSEYTRRIERFAADNEVPLLDLRAEFFDIPQYEQRLFLDSVHLNAQGNAIVAERLAARIAAR